MLPALFLLLTGAVSFDDTFRAGLLALQRNDLTAAVSNLESASKLAPSNGRVWVALSQTYRKLGEASKADSAARRAITFGENDPMVLQTLETSYFTAAQPLLKEQDFGDAAAILEPAGKLLPRSAQIALALGVAYYGLRRFDAAAGAFLRTITIDPSVEQPYVFLGKFLDQIPDRLPEIAKRFAEYERAQPSSPTGYLLHAKTVRPEDAVPLLEKSLSIDASNASAHFDLAAAFDQLARVDDACREFEKTVTLDPANSAAHYRLARDYERLGKHDAAQLERERHEALVKTEGGMH